MTNGSTRPNRHGIANVDGGGPGRCRWPRCPKGVAGWLKLPLCQSHADIVCDVVVKDREQISKTIEDRRAPKKPAKPEKPRQDVIYYLRIEGSIKIGYTSQLERRMRHYPPNSTLLAVHPGDRADERALHKRFAVHRSHGQEWYPLVPVLLAHIDKMVQLHGEPPKITFGAKPVDVYRTPKTKSNLRAK